MRFEERELYSESFYNAYRGIEMATAKEIDMLVKDAARRKKEEDNRKSLEEKNRSRDAAIDQRKQLEVDMTRKRLDYARIAKLAILVGAIILMWFIIATTISFMAVQKKDVWKKPAVTREDYTKASEYVGQTIAKASKKENIETFFVAGVPSHWLSSAKNILSAPGIKDYKAGEARFDEGKLGSEAVFFVDCSNPAGEKISFTLTMNNGNFSILKIDGPPPKAEDKKKEEKKNGKK